MTGKLIIYGATGDTEQLVSEQAKRAGSISSSLAAMPKRFGRWPRSSAFRDTCWSNLRSAGERNSLWLMQGIIGTSGL
jgi:hypothetical protein